MRCTKSCIITMAGLLAWGSATSARNPKEIGPGGSGERSSSQVGVVVSFGPPELPVYEQPICPGDGYLWTPGYWAWDDDDDDYYWVPGTWILPPEVGFLWTPGYWAWGEGGFVFTEGYWGPLVGFYGGINYGFGYFGHGYEGGRWENGHFFYNTTINRVNVTEIHNVYNTTVVVNNNTRVSYNGGKGGLDARATAQEQAAAHERHIAPVSAQTQHVQTARTDPALRASQNHGKPPIAATARPGAFSGGGVVAAKEGGRYNPPPANERRTSHPNTQPSNSPPASSRSAAPNANPNTAIHPRELPPHARPEAPNTGNPNLDKKYQQEQDKLRAKQEQEHQKLQQKQDQEHQRLEKQQANEARKQQTEQKHQQQTQQMEQRHAQQQQRLQQRQQPPPQQRQAPPPRPKKEG